MTTLTLFVAGAAKPQGSKISYGRGRVVESSKDLPAWRQSVGYAIRVAMNAKPLMTGAVTVDLEFVLPRPKSHPKTKTPPMTRNPDLDKLVRGILDAMTHTAVHDDSQVTTIYATKRTAEPDETPGVGIVIENGEPP